MQNKERGEKDCIADDSYKSKVFHFKYLSGLSYNSGQYMLASGSLLSRSIEGRSGNFSFILCSTIAVASSIILSESSVMTLLLLISAAGIWAESANMPPSKSDICERDWSASGIIEVRPF